MRKRILGILVLALTLVAAYKLVAHFSGGDLRPVLALIATVPLPAWLLLAALTAAFYWLDWVRFRSLLAVLGQRLATRRGLQLTCVSNFITCLTPNTELHTPAMVFMLHRWDVPLPQALAASVTKSIYMTLWICLVAYVALAVDDSIRLPEDLRIGLPVLTLPLLGIVLVLGLIAFFPGFVCRWCTRASAGLAEHSIKRRVLMGTANTATSVSGIVKSGSAQHWLCHLASIACLLAYICIGWVLALNMGFELSLPHAITVFSASLMIAYLAPVPGAIGVAEIATSYMLDPAFTPAGMAVSLALRVLCWYLLTVPGGVILARMLYQQGQGWSLPSVFGKR